jgi:SecD/SecF fusion protein
MRSKGLILFFVTALALVSLYQYMLVLPTNGVESDAKAFAREAVASNPNASERAAYAQYLNKHSNDTIWSIPLIKSYTYNELKKGQLAMGLDLKGGMSVLLQVNLEDFLKSLSGGSTDPNFAAAMVKAKEMQKTSREDYITLFARAYKEGSGGATLANVFARSSTLKDQINFNSTDEQVTQAIRAKANGVVNETFNRMKERIDKLGVVQPNVSLDASRDIILVELPGIDNTERARSMLESAANLEFWRTYRGGDAVNGRAVLDGLTEADKALKATIGGGVDTTKAPTMRKDTSYVFKTDANGNVDSTQKEMVIKDVPTDVAPTGGPLLSILQLFPPQERGAVIGACAKENRDTILKMLERPEVRAFFPKDAVNFRFSGKPQPEGSNFYQLYALKAERDDKAPLDGSVVDRATSELDSRRGGDVSVSLGMNQEGARIWSELTKEAATGGNREIAITLDDEVVSAPSVNEPINGGNSSITGGFSLDEAKDLSAKLEVGKLPAKAEIISENQVGPSLGQDNINKSLTTMLLSLTLLCLFMWVYYAGGGVISIIALLANIFFLMGTLANMGTVLTLPGIAGIVLTLAAAVDANVIIYERIREELRHGLGLYDAVTTGFKRSFSAILDANVTTMLTALVLMWFGLGPIKGFGTVLCVGIITTMLTAVLLSRMLTEYWLDKGKTLSYSMPWSAHVMENVNIPWMAMRKKAYMISAVLLAISIAAIAIRGFELGVDFKGGYSYNVQFDQPVQVDVLRTALGSAFEGASTIVKEVPGQNTYNITTSYLADQTGAEAINKVTDKLAGGLKAVGLTVDPAKFKNTEGTGTHIISSNQVGPAVADDIRNSSFYAGFWAIALIFLYLLIRFSKWQFSLGAILALLHDVLITLGFFALLHGKVPFSLEFDQSIIACILTVIGLSVNDTVIVFDRIREFVRQYSGRPKEEVFDMAINSTLSRTLITSGTIALVSFLLWIFGGSATKGFSFGMFIGIVIGTYSSVYVASALVVDLTKEKVLNLTNIGLGGASSEVVENVDKKAEKKAAKA